MTMHLEGPWLSTTGKKKGKQKFKSADAKRKAEQLRLEWEEKQKEWAKLSPKSKKIPKGVEPYKSPAPYVRQTEKIPSLPFTGGACTKKDSPKYTGTLIKGIGTMHKSNAVPILNDDEAKAIASMRR